MLKVREKRRAIEAKRAVARLAAVKAAIIALDDEDLLDFADIFSEREATPLRDIAEAEMRRRDISL
ncbi:MAG: hypothetical protein PGN12_10165 [Sphingomonas phyllosphaerae]